MLCTLKLPLGRESLRQLHQGCVTPCLFFWRVSRGSFGAESDEFLYWTGLQKGRYSAQYFVTMSVFSASLAILLVRGKTRRISLSLLYYVRCFNELSPNVQLCKHSLYNIIWPSCNSVYEIKCLLKKILNYISLRHLW